MDRSKNALPDQSKVIFVVPTYISWKKKSYTDKKKVESHSFLIGASYGLKDENFGPPYRGFIDTILIN